MTSGGVDIMASMGSTIRMPTTVQMRDMIKVAVMVVCTASCREWWSCAP